jgi:hypothetical protein
VGVGVCVSERVCVSDGAEYTLDRSSTATCGHNDQGNARGSARCGVGHTANPYRVCLSEHIASTSAKEGESERKSE